MSGSTKRTAALAAGAILVGAAAGVLLLLRGPTRESRASGPETRPTVTPPVGRARAAEGDAPASREESGAGEVKGGEDAARALAEALLPRVGREGAAKEALRAARAGEIDPTDLGLQLREALREAPATAHVLVPELAAERRPEIALKLAQALQEAMDDAGVRQATIEALGAAGPAARAVGLLALLGRGEPEAQALALRSFLADPPDAQATAGFLLNESPRALAAADEGRARARARAALDDPGTLDRVREESLGLLGRPGAEPGDLDRMAHALLVGPEPAVRGRGFRALLECGAPRERVRPVLERALAATDVPEELKTAIRARLGGGS